MKLYQCDFCKKNRPCTQTVIDARQYDICKACRDDREAQLKGRGEAAPGLTWFNPWLYGPYYVPYPIYVPQPNPVSQHPWSPVIYWSGDLGSSDSGTVTLDGVVCSNTTTRQLTQ